MTDGLERIEKLFEEVRSKVAHCRNEATSDMADIQDAYSRLYRLRERYRYEAPTLDPTERAALRKEAVTAIECIVSTFAEAGYEPAQKFWWAVANDGDRTRFIIEGV